MEVVKSIETRRSIRLYNKKVPDRKLIKEIIDAGRFAPSSCNLQRWHFLVVDDLGIKKRLFSEAKVGHHINGAPVAVVVSTDSRYSQEHHADIQSVSAAVQNMLLKAHSLGLGTLWMASIGDTKIIKQILDYPKHYTIHSIFLLGYPSFIPEIPKKRPLDEIMSFNKFQEFYIPSTTNLNKWSDSQIHEFKTTYIRARSGFSWRKLNPQQATILDYLFKNFSMDNYLDIFPYPGRHLYTVSKKYKKNFSILQRGDSTARYLVNEVADNDKINIENEKKPSKKYKKALIFETYESTRNKEEFIKNLKKYLSDDAELYLIYRNSHIIQRLYFLFANKFTLLHRYFGPVKLESFSKIKKTFEKEGFKATFVCGSGITPFDNILKEGTIGKFLKLGLIKLELVKK